MDVIKIDSNQYIEKLKILGNCRIITDECVCIDWGATGCYCNKGFKVRFYAEPETLYWVYNDKR